MGMTIGVAAMAIGGVVGAVVVVAGVSLGQIAVSWIQDELEIRRLKRDIKRNGWGN